MEMRRIVLKNIIGSIMGLVGIGQNATAEAPKSTKDGKAFEKKAIEDVR
jgi:hypothetical protein